jgi:hypothetical protein
VIAIIPDVPDGVMVNAGPGFDPPHPYNDAAKHQAATNIERIDISQANEV